jgi:hypothetical protein
MTPQVVSPEPTKKIAGLYSGIYAQWAFYQDPEFGLRFALLPVWELATANLDDYLALWIPPESNQLILMRHREQFLAYLEAGGIIVCFEGANHAWLPEQGCQLQPLHLESLQPPLAPQRGESDLAGISLSLDERSYRGKLLVGTIAPPGQVDFKAEATRPLLRAMLAWLDSAGAGGTRAPAAGASGSSGMSPLNAQGILWLGEAISPPSGPPVFSSLFNL